MDLNGNGGVNPDAGAGFRRTKRTTTSTRIRLEDGSVVEIRSPGAEDGSQSPSLPEEGEVEEEVIEVRLTPEEPTTTTTTTQVNEKTEEEKQNKEKAPLDDEDDDDGLTVVPSWDGVQEGGKPLSRVERRQRIKAEIQRLSKGDAPVYYQRRLW